MDEQLIKNVLATVNAGKPYDDVAPKITVVRNWALDLCRQYNFEYYRTGKANLAMLKKLFAKTPANGFTVLPNFHVEFGRNIFLGRNFFANYDCFFMDCAPIKFGDEVKIGPKCGFYTSNHVEDAVGRRAGYVESRPITVGNNVWFGASVTVVGGVTIGDNSIIGAGSVVVDDIPANVIAAGNPARVIRPLRTDDRYRGMEDRTGDYHYGE